MVGLIIGIVGMAVLAAIFVKRLIRQKRAEIIAEIRHLAGEAERAGRPDCVVSYRVCIAIVEDKLVPRFWLIFDLRD